MPPLLHAVQGDITAERVDAVVNAANRHLRGGGGVDGAIHRAAGPDLLKECRTLSGCNTGDAKLTKGYRLPAKFVIHAVGPVWQGGGKGEDELLAGCYRACFDLTREHGVTSIAFPAISTGVYRFPRQRACGIAIAATRDELAKSPQIERGVFACFDAETLGLYETALAA